MQGHGTLKAVKYHDFLFQTFNIFFDDINEFAQPFQK